MIKIGIPYKAKLLNHKVNAEIPKHVCYNTDTFVNSNKGNEIMFTGLDGFSSSFKKWVNENSIYKKTLDEYYKELEAFKEEEPEEYARIINTEPRLKITSYVINSILKDGDKEKEYIAQKLSIVDKDSNDELGYYEAFYDDYGNIFDSIFNLY